MSLADLFFKSAMQLIMQVHHFEVQYFKMAGFQIRIACLVPEMNKRIYPAFSHLQAPEGKEDLSIYVLCQQNMPYPLKLLSGYQQQLGSRGEVAHLSNDNIQTIYNHHDGAFNLIHLKKNIAIYWVRSVAHMPWWIAGSPLQRIIACWMRGQGLELTHAAVVANQHSAIILAGKSGSGKSTTTLSCIDSGLFCLSEDYCLIDMKTRAQVFSVYNSLKLEPGTLTRFPQYARHAVNQARAPHEKALMFQHDIYPRQLCDARPIKAIVSLKLGKKTMLEPCHPGINTLALAASSILQLSASTQVTLTRFKTLCLEQDCYQLTLGGDMKDNVAQIKQLLGQI